MNLAYYCMNDSEHRMFKGRNLDGARCPQCKGLVNIKPVSDEQYYELLTYSELRKKFNSKPTNKNTKAISVEVEMNTDKLQLKLRAIAKRAEALANELDVIDNDDDELPTRLEGSE